MGVPPTRDRWTLSCCGLDILKREKHGGWLRTRGGLSLDEFKTRKAIRFVETYRVRLCIDYDADTAEAYLHAHRDIEDVP